MNKPTFTYWLKDFIESWKKPIEETIEVMKTSNYGLDLIKKYEGLRLLPYLCPAKIPTIGYGSTYYENGVKVTMQDAEITKERAEQLLKNVVKEFEGYVLKYVKSNINQFQFDALVSFTYNLGPVNLKKSTLLKKVNNNPSDISIHDEFMKWNKAGGKVLVGLTRRRKEESNLYFNT